MVNIENFITHTQNFAIFFTAVGLLGELKNKQGDISRCLAANGNLGLSILLVGTSVKIYKDFTN